MAKVELVSFHPLLYEIHHIDHLVYINFLLLYQGKESFVSHWHVIIFLYK